jgi:uncharacterized protein YndB with AHSA1/START domain
MTDTPTAEDRYLDVTRAFRAPRSLVWRYWTEPALLSQWFGPDGFSAPLEHIEIDLRIGGVWNLSMRNDETGELFPLRADIVELVPEELLVGVAHAESDLGDMEHLELRVQFHDHGELTRVTLHQGPFTAEQRTATATGWEMSFVKLDALVETGTAQ